MEKLRYIKYRQISLVFDIHTLCQFDHISCADGLDEEQHFQRLHGFIPGQMGRFIILCKGVDIPSVMSGGKNGCCKECAGEK